MPSQTEGAVADGTAETLAVEEEALGAEPLHHVNPPGAEVAGVAAPEARREVFTHHTLRDRRSRVTQPVHADVTSRCQRVKVDYGM